MAETKVKRLDLESLITLVREAADAQEAQAVGSAGTCSAPQRLDSVGFTGGLFPEGVVASDPRPRKRKGQGVSALQLQRERQARVQDIAVALFDSTKALDQSTTAADEAQKRLEAVREILERQRMRGVGERSLRRGEYREFRAQDMDNNRDYWFHRNRLDDLERIDLRQLQNQLEYMRDRR